MLKSALISEISRILSVSLLQITCKTSVLYFNCNLHKFYSFYKHVPYNRKVYLSTIANNTQSVGDVIFDVLKLRDQNTSNSIIDSKVNDLCTYYKCLDKEEKYAFVLELACNYSVHNDDVCAVANTLVTGCNECQSIRLQEKLKTALTPKYKWLFIHVGRQENGVKFLVDMRTDVLQLLQEMTTSEDSSSAYLRQLNNTLRELFLLWFSVGFLRLKRVTWKSSCEMLQKISDYEAVHPVRSWTDLKTRMGPDRRCFVYTHSSMPDEPLVILHTALRQEIVSSTSGIIIQYANNKEIEMHRNLYKPENVKAAIFYSISSTQVGLQGIELGNYIIKRVATELTKEFPELCQFSSLSPIPNFKNWFYSILKRAHNSESFAEKYFYDHEMKALKNIFKREEIFQELIKHLNSNNWLQIPNLADTLKPILMRNCVRYLYLEKKRGYALDAVANFHLRNGAEMWRINWLADISARGLSASCGIMVNYRYYLDEAENNSKRYIEDKEIVISLIVENLLKDSNLY